MALTRDQIIEKTCELLELQGYHATGLNQIIKESGSPKGSLYHYFPGGKEALAVEALRHVGELVLRRIRDNLAREGEASTVIADFIRNIAYNVEQSGYRAGGPITTIALETAATSEPLRAQCERVYGEWQGAFVDRLRAQGMAPRQADSLGLLIIAAIEGGVILCRTRRSREPLEQIAREIGALVRQFS